MLAVFAVDSNLLKSWNLFPAKEEFFDIEENDWRSVCGWSGCSTLSDAADEDVKDVSDSDVSATTLGAILTSTFESKVD